MLIATMKLKHSDNCLAILENFDDNILKVLTHDKESIVAIVLYLKLLILFGYKFI